MTFQLIVNHRVAETAESPAETVRSARKYLCQPHRPSLEIVDLGGGIYRDDQVRALVDDMSDEQR